MIQAWLAKKAAGFSLAFALKLAAVAALGLLLWSWDARGRDIRLLEERNLALAQKVVDADEEVKKANASTLECGRANESSARTFEVYRQESKALRERGAKLDAQLAQARKQAATLLAESEAEDAAIERDPSHVPAQAHNEAIRRRGEGIWR